MCKLSFAYLVRCADGTLYAGWTNDPGARLAAHNSGAGAKYTRARRPVTLVYLERCDDRRAAMRREAALKRMTRAQKLTLIEAQKEDPFYPENKASGGILMPPDALFYQFFNFILNQNGQSFVHQ